MKACRSTEGLREYGAHLVAQLCDFLEIDDYELLSVEILDRQTGREYTWEEKKSGTYSD